MSRYILNEVETSHHLILIRLYFILTILITEDDHNHIVFDYSCIIMYNILLLSRNTPKLFACRNFSFMQFQHHNITSDKLSDQNNERFYHEKQTVENRRPSKMGDVATLLFVHFNFIIQLRNMFLFLKSIHIAYQVKFMLCLLSFIMLCFCFCFLKICIIIQCYVRSL